MLQMDKHEIAMSYKYAVDRKEQIKILAQLNGTTRTEIIDVLNEYDYNIPKPKVRKNTFWTEGRVNALLRFRKFNMPYVVIAETLGCSKSTIDAKLRELRAEGVYM